MADVLKNKIDFVALISVSMANPNGDPLNGNRPRQNQDNLGEMSDVCIKRKIRNRMLDLDEDVFVQSDDRKKPGDTYNSLKERADSEIGTVKKAGGVKRGTSKKAGKAKDNEESGGNALTREEFAKRACEKYLDVRSFGQVFAFSGDEEDSGKSGGTSVSVRGPVSVHQATSMDSVEIESMQITKSVNGSLSEDRKGNDTMGMKHFIRFGLYMVKGSINVQLAEKTGFTEEDAQTVKECLRTLFVNDASSARPDGSMEVVKLFWFRHNCKDGQCSSAKVHHSVIVSRKDKNKTPENFGDYTVTVDAAELNGLAWEDVEGVQ